MTERMFPLCGKLANGGDLFFRRESYGHHPTRQAAALAAAPRRREVAPEEDFPEELRALAAKARVHPGIVTDPGIPTNAQRPAPAVPQPAWSSAGARASSNSSSVRDSSGPDVLPADVVSHT